VLELLRIIEALKGDARAVFMDIVARRGGVKLGKGRRGRDRFPSPAYGADGLTLAAILDLH